MFWKLSSLSASSPVSWTEISWFSCLHFFLNSSFFCIYLNLAWFPIKMLYWFNPFFGYADGNAESCVRELECVCISWCCWIHIVLICRSFQGLLDCSSFFLIIFCPFYISLSVLIILGRCCCWIHSSIAHFFLYYFSLSVIQYWLNELRFSQLWSVKSYYKAISSFHFSCYKLFLAFKSISQCCDRSLFDNPLCVFLLPICGFKSCSFFRVVKVLSQRF